MECENHEAVIKSLSNLQSVIKSLSILKVLNLRLERAPVVVQSSLLLDEWLSCA